MNGVTKGTQTLADGENGVEKNAIGKSFGQSNSMFKWFKEEVGAVHTPKMFEFDRAPQLNKLQEVKNRYGKLPIDYVEFVQEYGQALMFRDRSVDIHLLGVFSYPRLVTDLIPEHLLEVGFCAEASAYFIPDASTQRIRSGVFSLRVSATKPHRVADTFEEWLKASFFGLKKLYGKQLWLEIQKGPRPFDAKETEIVNAISLFRWRRIGQTPSGKIRIEVHNGSPIRLPYLSIGVMVPEKLKGGVRLNVSDLKPGQSKVLEIDCYRKQVAPEDVQLFAQPLPSPQDRDYRWEFRSLHKAKARR